ncbi:MAG: hypothetical protein AAF915_24720 [Cyanobacteria bacterium P01_D01_bin.50]
MYHCGFAPIEDLFAKYRDDLQDDLREYPGFIGGTFLSAIESLYGVLSTFGDRDVSCLAEGRGQRAEGRNKGEGSYDFNS